MAIDIQSLINGVSREVSSSTIDGAEHRSVVATRSFGASRAEVWDAITSPERVVQWFLPLSGDLRQGGRYQLEGNAGGDIVECQAPERLALTWEWDGNVSWVDVRLQDEPHGGTSLRLEHRERVEQPDEFWQQYGAGAGGVGWDLALFGLDQHVVHGGGIGPDQAMEWLASDEGKAFVHHSSEAWGDASIAFGTDPDKARAAAARTTASYTGAEAATED